MPLLGIGKHFAESLQSLLEDCEKSYFLSRVGWMSDNPTPSLLLIISSGKIQACHDINNGAPGDDEE